MKKFITNKYTLFGLGIILFGIVWWIFSLAFDINGMIVPSPAVTFVKMFELFQDPYTFKCLGYTLLRVLIGFAISFIIAFILGVITGNSKVLRELVKPSMTIIKSVPTAAVVFLFVVLVSPKDAPILVTILISFPILYEAVANGLANVDPNVIQAANVDGANIVKRNLFVMIPLSFPYIGVGILASFSLSFKVEIMAEVITGYTANGLGSIIKASQIADPTDMTTIFGYSLIAVLLVLVISLVSDILKQKLKNR